MKYVCPTCQRTLYNRRLKNCGFCGAEIPENLRFTAAEVAVLDKKMAELEKEQIERERAASVAEEEKRKKDQSWIFIG